MSPANGFIPQEFYQKLRDLGIEGDFTLDPQTVPMWYVNNIIQRVIAQLMGYDGKRVLRIRCDSAGRLLVSMAQASPASYARYDYSAQATEATQTLPQVVNRIGIYLTAGSAQIRFSIDGVVYGPYINIPSGGDLTLDLQAYEFKINPIGTNFSGQVYVFY